MNLIFLLGWAKQTPHQSPNLKTQLSFAGGFKAILTDRNKLVVTVGGVTALAAGVYTTRYKLSIKFGMSCYK